ncbi:MAG TPA: hypothetical protein DCX07_04790 [Phycisphaerales bacterium]|nr:hypothetical protein [Phycisphaerales bacterium]
MRQAPVLLATLLLIAVTAAADVVYLRNGTKLEGEVTRAGDKVRIKMAYGEVEVDAAEVVYISKEETLAPATAPAKAPATAPDVKPGALKMSVPLDQTSQPEVLAFMILRNLAAGPSGDTFDVKRQLEQYRILAHERKRRAAGRWLDAKDFVRRRQAFQENLKSARDLLRKSPPATDTSAKARAERTRIDQAAGQKLQTAAKAWADPVLRGFLLGACYLNDGAYAQAEALFRDGCAAEPRVAAFHQGRAMALLNLQRELETVEELTLATRLSGGAKELLADLQDAMAKVPGAQAGTAAYQDAKGLLDDYGVTGRAAPRTAYQAQGITWMLPGRKVYVRDRSLPEPPYDRLYSKQAVGVPLGTRKLLVDSSVIDGALEVFVRIDDKTVVPARFQRFGNFGRGAPPPVAVLTLERYTFTPAEADEKKPPAPGEKGTACSLGLFEEMGSVIRESPAEVSAVAEDGAVRFSGGLAAGETASPVLSADGRLLGFLAGKTDVTSDNGGPDRWIALPSVAREVQQAKSAAGGYYGGAQAQAKPVAAEGKVFVVYGVFGETFKD